MQSPGDTFKQNQFLNELVDFGLPGLLVLMGWLYSLWSCARRLNPENRFIVEGFILVFILSNCSEQMLYWGVSSDFLGVMSILLLAYDSTQKEKRLGVSQVGPADS